MIRKLAALVALVMIATLSVAGCTLSSNIASSSNKPTPSPTPGLFGTPIAADKLAGPINDLYIEKGYTVNTPFRMTKRDDTITYDGVVTDGPQKLTPYRRNVTVVLVLNRDEARAIYRSAVDAQKALGYQEDLSGNSSSSAFWTGYLGTKYSSDPATRVRIDLNEPFYAGLILGGEWHENLFNADVGDYYQVLTDQQTLAT